MRQILAKAAACVTAVSLAAGMAVTASAEDKYMELISEEFPSCIEGATDYCIFGDGFFGYHNNDNRKVSFTSTDGIVRIGEDELNEWRESGEFTYKNVDCDLDLAGDDTVPYVAYRTGDNGDYICLCQIDPATNNATKLYSLKFDEKNNKLSLAYSIGQKQPHVNYDGIEGFHDWANMLTNGCAVAFDTKSDDTESTATVTVYAPNGEKHESNFSYIGDISKTPYNLCVDNSEDSEFIAYMVFPTAKKETIYDEDFSSYDISLYGFRADGSYETLYSIETASGLPIYGADNCCVFGTNIGPKAATLHAYYDGKVYDWEVSMDTIASNGNLIVEDETAENGRLIYWYAGLDSKPYGKKFIVHFMNGDKSAYALIDITTGKISSDIYLSMSTNDGKKYLVQTLDGKWGFMNNKGKLLKTYDDASEFKGEYAPVVKDGKGFLIDRDLKRVSEKIDADGCVTLTDGLYQFIQGDRALAVTFVEEPEESSEPVEPKTEEPETEEPKTEEPETEESKPEEPKTEEVKIEESKPDNTSKDTSTDNTPDTAPADLPDKANPETGAAGIAAVIAITALGASAAVMFRKRK